jgi:DNA-binding beta-propeller fold protein YncE
VIIQAANRTYQWISNWAALPEQTGWAHHGLAVLRDGTLLSGGASRPEIFRLSQQGKVLDRFSVPVTEVHGLTCSIENGKEILWIADIGNKYGINPTQPPQILKCTLQGEILAKLTREDFGYAADEPFSPTALSVDPDSGKVWITDGYGSAKIHCFSPDLEREMTLDGTTGAGRFSCPHWIFCDTREKAVRIYVADRRNNRIQVFRPDGSFLKCIDKGLITPSAFASFDDILVVAELNARIVLLDNNDRIIASIGEGRRYREREGWPNRLDENGKPADARSLLDEGTFNSPHGIAATPDGSIYVSEWLIGDRYTKLEPIEST